MRYYLRHYLWFVLIFYAQVSVADNFFEQRYRGWLWFEEHEKKQEIKERMQEQKKRQEKRQKIESARAKARGEVEAFAKELEALKYMMIRYPENLEHVIACKKKEAQMFETALKLDQSYRMVNFINPGQVDLLSNPTNLYGIKIKKELDSKEQQEQIKQLALEVELFLVFSSSCPYSVQVEAVLSSFAKKYGFKVEALSTDDIDDSGSTYATDSKYFKTHRNKQLLSRLGVEVTPTIIIVSNNGNTRFEFARGAVSISELEERAILARQYLKSQEQHQVGSSENIESASIKSSKSIAKSVKS